MSEPKHDDERAGRVPASETGTEPALPESQEAAIEEMRGLLQTERAAIRGAEFTGLIELAERKEQVLAQLTGAPMAALGPLREMAEENQRILAAALRGVRAAQQRLQSILAASQGFDAYDAEGRRKPIRRDGNSMERRA